ncbi:Uncharacterised protein [Serratia plymuthica]|uniref:Uncharacterized protein n=1 Tax=Serratia plymuthica TaxID=82996 RepID=A0A2X4U3E7_SERPL|nr:Uncharacterised protein [Serratia plymuthica]
MQFASYGGRQYAPAWRAGGRTLRDPAGDETVVLDFDTVIDKYLYLNTRTHGQPFELHLAQCDLSLGKNGQGDLQRQ